MAESESSIVRPSASVGQLAAVLTVDRSLLGPSAGLFAATCVGQALSFAVQILVARRIGTEAYGIYSYAFSWIGVLSTLALMGGDRLVIRFGSTYRADGEPALLRALLRWSSLVLLAAACGVALVSAAIAVLATQPGLHGRINIIGWSALAVLVLPASLLVESMLRCHADHTAASLPNRVLRPALFGILFLALPWATTSPPGAGTALALNTLAMLVAIAVVLPRLWRLLPARPAQAVDAPYRLWRATALGLGLNTLALYAVGQVDMLVLGLFHGGDVLGPYGAVMRIVTVMGFASTAVITIAQPMIASARARGATIELQRLVTGGARLTLAVNTVVGLIVMLFAEHLLAVFGADFVAGAPALRILAVGYLVSSMFSLSSALLCMSGRETISTGIMTIGGVCALGLGLVLTPFFADVGAAIGRTLGWVLFNGLMFMAAWRRLDIAAWPFSTSLLHGRATP